MCSSIQSSSFNSLPLSVLFVQLVLLFFPFKKKSWRVTVPCLGTRFVLFCIERAPDRDFIIVICAPLSVGIQRIQSTILFRRLNVELKAKLKRNGNFISWPSCAKKRQLAACSMSANTIAVVRWFFGAVELHSICCQRMGEKWMSWKVLNEKWTVFDFG